jgi:FkbM family methyltransferase
MLDLAIPGSVAIDVGANVGIHAIPLASKLAPGKLIAVEPLQRNAGRLLANALLNGIENLDLHVVAAGPSPGRVSLHLARDDAFASTAQVLRHWEGERVATVEQTTLDILWESTGRPAVSLVKIDVEGGEAGVLLGAARLLSRDRPAVVVEANSSEALDRVTRVLDGHGYHRVPSEGFEPWNHLFLAGAAASRGDAMTSVPGREKQADRRAD